jgi:ribosome-associated protein
MEPIRLGDGRAVPAEELAWTFARASGPGGQSVNTTDSAVRLAWDVTASRIFKEDERERIRRRLASRLSDGILVTTAREHRSQWANRKEAAGRLVELVDRALAPAPPNRRPTKPSRSARTKRLQGKRQRGEVKKMRQRPGDD